jgi:hypothetical protein
MLDSDLPECASCHSNHAIERFDLAGMDSLCAGCHGADSDEAVLGSKIHTMIASAQDEVLKAENLTQQGAQVALDVEDHLGRLEEARTHLTEAQTLIHAVSLSPVEEVTRRARSIGEEVQHEIYAKLDRRPAHIGLVVFWFYLVMTIAVLVGYKRRLRRESLS